MPARGASPALAMLLALSACVAQPSYESSAVKAHLRSPSPAAPAPKNEVSRGDRARIRRAIEEAMTGSDLEGPDRGAVRAVLPIEVASLPRLERATASGTAHRTMGRLDVTREGRPSLGADVVAEVSTRGYRAFLPATQPVVSPLRKDVGLALLTSAPGCVPGGYGAGETVTVDLFRSSGWSRTELSLSRLEGTMDWSTCSGSLDRSATVRAAAVIPGIVYAFVTRARKGDEIVVIGPPAEWVATSTPDAAAQLDPHVGSFTRLEAPLERGRSSTILFNVSGAALAQFLRLRGDRPSWEGASMSIGPIVSFSIEVVWPAGSEAPEGRAYVVSLEPGGDEVLAELGLFADPRR